MYVYINCNVNRIKQTNNQKNEVPKHLKSKNCISMQGMNLCLNQVSDNLNSILEDIQIVSV